MIAAFIEMIDMLLYVSMHSFCWAFVDIQERSRPRSMRNALRTTGPASVRSAIGNRPPRVSNAAAAEPGSPC